MDLIYDVNGENLMYTEEATIQESYDQDNETVDSKDKKPGRRYWLAKEEDCLFEIWGRDNWRLTQPGKNTTIFNKWSQELKERFNVDLKPLEIQNKVNTTRVKFRQVLKQCANDKNALTRWKKFYVVDKILRNQYRSLDAEEISPENLKKNRDMAFIERMTEILNESNLQSNDRCLEEKDNTIVSPIDKTADMFAANTYEVSGTSNNGITIKTELNNIVAVHENTQDEQLYQYLQHSQQQKHVDVHHQNNEQHLIISAQQTRGGEYCGEQSKVQQQPHEQLLHMQQHQPSQLLQPQQDLQYNTTLNSYVPVSQETQNQNTMQVSVIQTNQTQQVLQSHQQIENRYEHSITLPPQHQNQDQTIFVKPAPPSPLAQQQNQSQVNNVRGSSNHWNSQKRSTSIQSKRTYKSRTSNTNSANNVFQNNELKTSETMNQSSGKYSTSTSGFSPNKKRRISSIANSKEILKFREEWLKQKDVKNLNQSQEQQEQTKSDNEVVSNTSLRGATEVEMLYLAEVCRRNEILTEQKNISYKLLRLEEPKVALMESFFPKCFKLQEEFLGRTLQQSTQGTKNKSQGSNENN